jgi:hypothetical protein
MIFGFRVKQGCKTNHGTSHLPIRSARSYQKGEPSYSKTPPPKPIPNMRYLEDPKGLYKN